MDEKITIVECNGSYYGLCGPTDVVKPTEGIATGSWFLDVQTANVYFFNAVTTTWAKAGGE